MIRFFNTEKIVKILPDGNIEALKRELEKSLSIKKDINIIFVKQDQIRELNREYREKDEVTDLLSFNIDSEDILGEIYIYPEYIIKDISRENYKEQIVRILVHGILHLQGYDHKKKFKKIDYKDEPMYIKQEEIVNKILN